MWLSHFSCVQLCATLWTIACQSPLSVGFSKQEYWSGLPFPLPGDLPNLGIKLVSLIFPALAGRFFITSITWEALSPSWVSAQGKSQPSCSSQGSLMDHLMTARPAPFCRSASLSAHLGEFTRPHLTYLFLVYSTSQWNQPHVSHLQRASFQTQRSLCSVTSRLWIKKNFFKGNWH